MKKLLIIVLLMPFFWACKGNKESSEFFKRGNFHFKKNELDKAEHFFSEAIKKNPEFADAYNNRGVVYLKVGRTDEALKDFEKAVSLDNSFVDAKLNLGRLYSEIGKTTEAEGLYKSIERKMEKSSEFYNFFGQNFIRLNHFEEAEQMISKSLVINPKNIEALTNISYLKTITNQTEEARKYLAKAKAIDAENAVVLNNIAVLDGKERDFDGAIKNLLIAEYKELNNIIYINNLALFYFESDKYFLGKEKLEKAMKIDDKNPYTLRNLGIQAYLNKDFDKALEIFTNLEKANPEVDYLYYYLGKTLMAMANSKKACDNFKIGAKLKDHWSEKYAINCR
ncbi:MAG TPA: tetratricopeptide repeat protein [Leadbetterella sp.]|nr:tetratricopeptide repeat protein [Leadbetterella sp.]